MLVLIAVAIGWAESKLAGQLVRGAAVSGEPARVRATGARDRRGELALIGYVCGPGRYAHRAADSAARCSHRAAACARRADGHQLSESRSSPRTRATLILERAIAQQSTRYSSQRLVKDPHPHSSKLFIASSSAWSSNLLQMLLSVLQYPQSSPSPNAFEYSLPIHTEPESGILSGSFVSPSRCGIYLCISFVSFVLMQVARGHYCSLMRYLP